MNDELHGIWAAIPTPFDARDHVDIGAVHENVARLASLGIAGLYTTDADGEFYAVEIDEFRHLVEAVGMAGAKYGIPTMAGITWSNTSGVLARLQATVGSGIGGAHVGHPIFMEMTPTSVRAFWSDLNEAAPPGFQLVHYNSQRLPNVLTATDYIRLERECPALVGTKHVGESASQFYELVSTVPRLRHLTSEGVLTAFTFLGGAGVCSWLVTYNPTFMISWWEDCVAGRWPDALRKQRLVDQFIRLKFEVMGPKSYHAIRNKALSAASGFLVGDHRTRAPYQPVSIAVIEEFRRRVHVEIPEMEWSGR